MINFTKVGETLSTNFSFYGPKLLFYVLASVGLMQMFKKMGEIAGYAWVPVYRVWVPAKRVNKEHKFIMYLVFRAVETVLSTIGAFGMLLAFFVSFASLAGDAKRIPAEVFGNIPTDVVFVVCFLILILAVVAWIVSMVFWWGVCDALTKHFKAPSWIALIMLFFPWLAFLILGFGKWEPEEKHSYRDDYDGSGYYD